MTRTLMAGAHTFRPQVHAQCLGARMGASAGNAGFKEANRFSLLLNFLETLICAPKRRCNGRGTFYCRVSRRNGVPGSDFE